MKADMVYMERLSQVAGVVYRKIGTEYGLEVSRQQGPMVPVVIGALRALMPKLGEWRQQIPGRSEISVHKSVVLAKLILKLMVKNPS